VTSAPVTPEREHRTTAEADATLRRIGIDVCVKPCVVVERADSATAVVDEVVRYP
jgi:hypothetical protein